MNKSEQPVLDDIDELIATELDEDGVPLDDYNSDRYVRCERCQGHWHGLPNAYGCPGAWADELKPIATLDVPIEPDYQGFTAVCINEEGHAVYGMITFASRTTALFIPYAEQQGEQQGLECDLYTFDIEAGQLNVQLMPETTDRLVPLGFSDLGFVEDMLENPDVAP